MNASAWTLSWASERTNPQHHTRPPEKWHKTTFLSTAFNNCLKHLHCNWGHMGTTPREFYTNIPCSQAFSFGATTMLFTVKGTITFLKIESGMHNRHSRHGKEPAPGRAPQKGLSIHAQTTEHFTLAVSYTNVKKNKKYLRKQPRSVFLLSLINLFIPGMVGEIMRLSSLLVLKFFQVAGCLTLDF